MKLYTFSENSLVVPKTFQIEKADPELWAQFQSLKGPKRFQVFADFFKKDTLFLAYSDEGLSVIDQALGEFHLDFADREYHRKAVVKDPFTKAIGKSKHIADFTAGLLKDSFYFLNRSLQVTAFEKNPLIFFLTQEALLRYGKPTNLKHSLQNSCELKKLEYSIDCIYVDPMFEEVSDSALPQKEFQFMRKLLPAVDKSVENEELLEHALGLGVERVIVKRPIKAGYLLKNPQTSFSGKTIRYDIYLR